MLTVEDGMIVLVSCFAAFSFSIFVIAYFNVCGSFSSILAAKLCAFLRPLVKLLMVAVSFVKLHLLA